MLLLFFRILIKDKASQQPFEMGNLSTALLGFRFSCTRIICFVEIYFFGLVEEKKIQEFMKRIKSVNGRKIYFTN
jgi:hypothetical protein